MIVSNNSHEAIYFDGSRNKIIEKNNFILDVDKLKNASLEAHISNSKNFSQSPNYYESVVPGIFIIPPRTQWVKKGSEFNPLIQGLSVSKRTSDDLKELFALIKRHIQYVGPSNIAVETSGGLDTSIIIGLISHLTSECKLVGIVSDRYEFRTERYIQECMFEKSSLIERIPEEKCFPYSKLTEVPFHYLPNKASLFYARHHAVASSARELGAKLVLNGMSLEALLIEPLEDYKTKLSACKWMWDDSWPNEYIYRPEKVEYINIAGRLPYYRWAARARFEEGYDPLRLWARQFFAEVLPKELVKYQYKAAFDGIYEDGLQRSLKDIEEIGRVAFELTRKKELHPDNMKKYIRRSSKLTHEEYVEMMAIFSFATWIYSALKSGI